MLLLKVLVDLVIWKDASPGRVEGRILRRRLALNTSRQTLLSLCEL